MQITKVAIVPISLFLSACVHLTQEQCLNTNWEQFGYNDGVQGKNPNTLAREIEDCAKFHIPVNTQAYQHGWIRGMKNYCSPSVEQGKSDGSNGIDAHTILNRNTQCLKASLPLTLKQYQAGFQIGQRLYCTSDNGFTIGLQGQQPPEVCQGPLKNRFIQGWEAGARQFCSNTNNAYIAGKEGKPYPVACPSTIYYAFKAEYDRGTTLRQNMSNVQNQIASIDQTISNLVYQWKLQKTFDARGYELGEDQSDNAKRALMEVKELMARRSSLEGQKIQLEVTR
ncbi:MAG: hypothetical protein LEGION0398_MBIBDBAK_00746 [Legionellaceae bacterium]